MSNHHLRNTELSLKAKGLLSLMLSLPENWDYTTKGLAAICKDGIDSISSCIRELEKHGYIIRERMRNEKGQLTTIEYTILEQPKSAPPNREKSIRENPILDKPVQAEPIQENTAQLNTNILNKKELNTDVSNTYPIKSYQKEVEPTRPADAQKENSDRIGYDEVETYRQIIKENIDYDVLSVNLNRDAAMLDEIVDLMTETVCTQKSSLVIAGDTYPAAIVKSKLLKLTSEHIEYVIDCMRENTSDIRNIKKYLLAALFNAPSTIDSYYTTKVHHDIRECDNKQKAFFVNNGNIIETVNVYPRDTITIFDNEKELDYKIQNADVSENYEIEKVYADAWIKIKNCLSNAQLSKLKYVILNTNGIGGGGISFEESLPIQYHIDEMLNANKYEKQGLFNGMILHADFMDVTCEMGNLYNEQRLLEDINLAWINRKNGVDIPAKWAYESISDGIKKKILTSDMLVDFNEPINRADFCDILYSFVQQKYNVDDNEKKSFFTDTSKQSVNFLADVGIVNGMEDKLFIPNGLLTREQAALMLARITNLFNIQDENSNENKYNDEDYISEWAQKGVMKMHRLGIMMGDENECFNPQKNCTKEEVIVAIMRLYKLF